MRNTNLFRKITSEIRWASAHTRSQANTYARAHLNLERQITYLFVSSRTLIYFEHVFLPFHKASIFFFLAEGNNDFKAVTAYLTTQFFPDYYLTI